MSATYTPGPWRVTPGITQMSDMGTTVCHLGAIGIYSDAEEHGDRSADARLIASAPDLLDALRRLSDQCERMRLPGQAMSDAERNSLRVISKATGASA